MLAPTTRLSGAVGSYEIPSVVQIAVPGASHPPRMRPGAHSPGFGACWEDGRQADIPPVQHPGSGCKEVRYAHRVNTRAMSPDEVLRASAEWISVWFPAHSVHTDLGWLEYYLLDGTATVMRVRPDDAAAAEFATRVLTELWRQGATQIHWQTGPGSLPAGVDQVLTGLGASVHETIDICAYSLDRDLPIGSHAPDVSVRPVRSRDDVAQFERASAQAWGYPAPSEEDIDKTFAGSTEGHFIGCWRGVPAGAGGYGLVGDVARFWGTAVKPEFRGRGVYRGLVHARMEAARNRGAKLALVHARPTSSPILQRLGFAVFGQRKIWSIPR